MIYYNGELLNLTERNCKQKPEGDIEGDTYREIEAIRSKYFGEDKKGVVTLRYPNGIRKKHESDGRSGKQAMRYEPKKIFLLSLKSGDGLWQWSDKAAGLNSKYKRLGDKIKVSDPWMFYEDDIDLVWFLQKHCPQVKNGAVYFEDYEVLAEKQAKDTFGDIELKYMLSAKHSPLANDLKMLRSVASAFDIEDANKMGKWELRNVIYNAVSAGEKRNDKYVNAERLQLLTDNGAKMSAINTVRKYMNMDIIKWNSKEKAWWVYADDEWQAELLKIKATDISNKTHILFDKIASDSTFKGKVYSELGISNFQSKAEVKDLGRPAVFKMCNAEGIETTTKDTLDQLVEKYCEKLGIA